MQDLYHQQFDWCRGGPGLMVTWLQELPFRDEEDLVQSLYLRLSCVLGLYTI